MIKSLFVVFLLLSFVSCYRVSDEIEPSMYCALDEHFLKSLPSAFPPINKEELQDDKGKEFFIAKAFAKQLDLYRAISTFKRADILMHSQDYERKLETEYDIFLCYYLGKKYQEGIEHFEKSELPYVDSTFPAFHDLLVSLYESYLKIGDHDKSQRISGLIEQSYPETAEKLHLGTALISVDLEKVQQVADQFPHRSYLDEMLSQYHQNKKSIGKAQLFNALLPGSGYFYLGQKKTAITSFLLNGCFIAAAYHFFHKGQIAAGIITSGFEMGWYFGGIYGAGESAKFYNERLYEREAGQIMHEHRLFPLLMLEHAF